MSPEWQEWLFNAYTIGETSQPPTGSSLIYSPTDDVKLMEAINLNIPAWQIFLHPTQQEAVDDLSSKSIAITGGPGTGKTIVLLNRILSHAPKGKDKDCSVILTYSASLAGYIYDRLKFTSSRYFHVFPLYFLGGKLPDHIPDETAFKKFKLVIENGKLVLQYKGSESRPVRELLVDEFQDAPSEVARTLEMLIASGFTRVTIAADLDQSIFRVNKQDIVVPMQLCEKHYELTYCYRSTRQIINKATEWLTTFNLETSSKVVYALSGPRVRLVSCKDLSHQVEETEKVFSDLQKRYSHDSLALIYCQYFNPSFKGKSIEEDILKSHSVLSKYYHFASTTKGQEFFAGALFISNTFLSKHLGTNADRLRINTLYVALTRFRDEVTVVYPEGCAIESMLQKLDNLE